MMKNILKTIILFTILFSPFGAMVHSEEAENINEEIAAADAPVAENTTENVEVTTTDVEVTTTDTESEVALATNEDSPPVTVPVVEDTDTLNTIENINIDVENGVGIVTISTSFAASYEEIDRETNKYSLKLTNVILDDRLQVARDLSDFDTPLNFLSSFRDPLDETNVIVVAELKEDVDVQLNQVDNIIKIKIGKTPEEKIAEELEEEEDVDQELWAFDIRSASVGGVDKDYKGQLVSFDFKDADVRDVLRILADISGFNLIIHSGVRGNLTLRLANVPWDQAMDIVLEEKGLGAILEGNILKIAPVNILSARQRQRLNAAASRESTEPLETKQLLINYATAGELVPLIDSRLSSRGSLRVDTRTNSILLTDTSGRIESVEELIATLDIPEPQVLIESRIVQATLDFTRELGVQWGLNYRASAATGNPTGAVFPSDVQVGGVQSGSPDAFGNLGNDFIVDFPAATGQGAGTAVGLILGSLTGAYDLDIRLSALETRGDGRILSSPKILTLNNQSASITQGVSIPFLSVSSAGTQTQFVDASLTLDVTPQVTNDDNILMEISVQDNAPDPATTGAGGQPGIRTNEADTNVIAADGETVVIGGIFTRQASENFGGVPWFSRLPLFGMFFRNTQTVDQRRELLVFITPRIIR